MNVRSSPQSRIALKPVSAGTTEVHEPVGADTVFTLPPNLPGTITFTYGGGPVLAAPSIKPIFWGGEWGSPNPPISPAAIVDAIIRIIDGPYLNSLGQYGISGKPTLLDSMYVLDSEPPSIPTLGQLSSATRNLLVRLIDDDQLAEPDENWAQLNVVFLASTSAYPPSPTGGIVTGAHGEVRWQDYDIGDVDDDPVRFAFIGTQALGSVSALDMTTSTFAHELVEAMSDPDNRSGWRQRPDPGGGTGEIGDLCGQIGRLDGIAVQSYWSNADNQCVIPMRDHSTSLSRFVFQEGPSVNGPDQQVVVDQTCGDSDRWTGTYTFHTVEHAITIKLAATTMGYSDPTGAWTVAGVSVKAGVPQTIRVTLSVLYPGIFAPIESVRIVTLIVTATETTLQISNDPADGNFDVIVTYTATEKADNLVPTISARRWSTDVSIEGRTIWAPNDFAEAQSSCIRAQTAAIKHDMENLRDLMNAFVQFVANHGGPPINQDLLNDVQQKAFGLSNQLRLNAQSIADIAQVRENPFFSGGGEANS